MKMTISNLFYGSLTLENQYSDSADIVLECNDTVDFTRKLADESIQLIITSPPYNIGKSYETRVSINEYLDSQAELITELVRVLHPNGSICWQVGNYVEKSEVFPLDIYFYPLFKDAGLQLEGSVYQ